MWHNLKAHTQLGPFLVQSFVWPFVLLIFDCCLIRYLIIFYNYLTRICIQVIWVLIDQHCHLPAMLLCLPALAHLIPCLMLWLIALLFCSASHLLLTWVCPFTMPYVLSLPDFCQHAESVSTEYLFKIVETNFW